MRNLSLYKVLFIVAITLGIISCQEYDIDTQAAIGTKYVVSALDGYVVEGVSASDIQFNISSNREWTITSDKQWCKVTPESSSSSSLISDIVVKCTDNSDINAPRIANLIVTVDGEKITTITVTQGQKSALNITPITEVISAGGGKKSFIISSNMPWEVSADVSWIRFDEVRGGESGSLKDYTVVATIDPNTLASRSAIVSVVSGKEEPKSFVVIQSGVTFQIEQPLESSVNATGGVINIKVDANIEWDATGATAIGWSYVSFKKIDNSTLEVKLPANNKFSQTKTTVITLAPKDATYASLVRSVELVQNGGFFLDCVAPGTAIIGEDGSVKLTSSNGAKSRIKVNKTYGYGTFIWKFAEINCNGKGHFELHADGLDHRYKLFLSQTDALNNSSFFIKSFNSAPLASPKFTFTRDQLSKMKELKVEVKPSADKTKVLITVYADNVKIAENDKLINVWENTSITKNRPTIYFGFAPAATDANESSMTIESFDIIEYVE